MRKRVFKKSRPVQITVVKPAAAYFLSHFFKRSIFSWSIYDYPSMFIRSYPKLSFFLLPLLTSLIGVGVVYLINLYFDITLPFFLFAFSVVFCSLYGGFSYGLMAILLSSLLTVSIYEHNFLLNTNMPVRIAVYDLEGLLIAWISHLQRQSRLKYSHLLLKEHLTRLKAQKTTLLLKQNRSQFQKLFDSNIIGISIWEENGRVISANDAYLKITGFSKADLKKGKINWITITAPEYKDNIPAVFNRIKMIGLSEPIEKEYIQKSGQKISVLVGATIVDSSNGLGITYVLDNSSAKLRERQKDDFIAIASHELKNPITSIKAFTQLMKLKGNSLSKQELTQYLERVDNQANHLNNLVSDLLDVSKMTSGNLSLSKSRFPFDQLLENVVKDYQTTDSSHTINLSSKTKSVIYADRDRISQVFINLISNAIKYSPQSNKIKVNATKTGNLLKVKIKDYGIGISQDNQKKIFDRFFRVDSGSDSIKGLGLGLYITNQIVKLHGGKISLRSRLNKGSTFEVLLPLSSKEKGS